MLEVDALKFAYPGNDSPKMCFELEVPAGEILSLIGPSGSGKSTLLNLIAGFIEAESGQIRIAGQAVETMPAAKRPVTMVFQQHNLFPHLDLYTNIALGADASLRLNEAQRQQVIDAIERLGLVGLEQRKPGALSGGQRQRVALARAMVRAREVLLLDEAFAALGPALRAELIELVAELVRERGIVALMVSHQPKDALIASPRTAFVHDGQVTVLQATQQLLQSPEQAEVREYLGSL